MNIVYWVLVCAGHIVSLLILQNSFLSKKSVITARSSCNDVLAGSNCWTKPLYKRAIVVLIDALRYDFINRTSEDDNLFMENTMQTLNKDPEHARLYKFIADAPTTTMQRITAMMTGSFPAFIEAGANFAAAEVEEDNLLSQMNNSAKHVVFYGDDTWTQLFPNYFSEAVPMDSFNVKDLDVVDSAVKPLLLNAQRQLLNSSLIIGHFLGVDHCGHSYGPSHPEMVRKLREMDDVVHELVTNLDDDTVLLVFGDHGMTTHGDHGGDSFLETNAALFIYSPKGFHSYFSDTVRQIDVVPTLALLLDVPIPFSSLGMVIRDFFDTVALPSIGSINVRQVIRYVDYYMQGNSEVEKAAKKTIMYYEQTSGTQTENAEFETIDELRKLLIHSMNRFDTGAVRTGTTSLLESLVLNLSLCFSYQSYDTIPFAIFHSAILLLRLTSYLGNRGGDLILNLAMYASICYRIFIAGTVVPRKLPSITFIIPLVIHLIYCFLPFSNSFIIYGADCARYFASTMAIFVGYRCVLREKKPMNYVMSTLIILIGIRLGTLNLRCREEHPECEEAFFSKHITQLSDDYTKVSRMIISGIALTFFAKRLQSGNDIVHILKRVMCIVTYFNWMFGFQQDQKFKNYGLYSAQIALLLFVVSVVLSYRHENRRNLVPRVLDLFIILLSVLGGDGILVQLIATREFLMALKEMSPKLDSITIATSLSLLSWVIFYSTGHNPVFSDIPFRAAFVFFSGESLVRSAQGLFVILHLFCGSVFTGLSVVDLQETHKSAAPIFVLVSTLQTAISCSAAIAHRKHLMMYKVFAPQFLFSAVGLIISMSVIILSRVFLK
ncbi:unnamed protein product [Bursaphelenchus okinawaensis]|uniref:GPI ethanolamine phosphate transferase 3 n=1 Tax=Bursaphelenchus okinawaensis TaxID=465554 RepID=A0A811JTV1_9BILA|nr:unnamed protein product [Bursaphelenchus okinawaensis]CAG9082843.1 unnamed protein product [Bursaphelenchus okinawaensis]